MKILKIFLRLSLIALMLTIIFNVPIKLDEYQVPFTFLNIFLITLSSLVEVFIIGFQLIKIYDLLDEY